MISNDILKTDKTLKERGIPEDSFFEVVFTDGSTVSEKDVSWRSFSHNQIADYLGREKMYFISNHQIKSIRITLGGMETEIEVPEGMEAYQYMRSERLVTNGVDQNSIVGRGIGIIKDGIVIEERFINSIEGCITGIRK